jgi:predicted MFS family arabinose efflux permease
MNITTMQMYWLVMLDNITSSLVAILSICGLFFVLGIPMLGATEKEDLFPSIAKKLLVVAAASLLGLTFIPSTKEMAAIMIVPRLANSEKVQTIGNKVYDLAVEWMEELKPNKKGEAK